ncbi:MAG: RC-LH1 core complex protein PufX [Pseudomonadota bacterium]
MDFEKKGLFERGEGSQSDLLKNVSKQMAVGALFASLVIVGPILFIYVTYLVGTLLPPESKEAADPTPDSFSSVYELRIDRVV